jgi:hypothetical protein
MKPIYQDLNIKKQYYLAAIFIEIDGLRLKNYSHI